MLVAGVIFFTASVVTAAFADSKPAVGLRGHHADKNKDGVVDQKEIQIQKAEHQEKALVDTKWEAKADTNNDGVVDAHEKMVSWKHGKAKVNTPLEAKYDANHDGWLEPAEAKELVTDRYELIKTGGKATVDTDIEKQYDANKDGILDQREARVMFDDIQ